MCIGLSSVDHMKFISKSDSSSISTSNDVENKMEFTYDSFVQEEIVEVANDDDENDNNDNNEDNCNTEDTPTIIQQLPLLKTTPRTVVISPKQSQGPIAISKHLSKPVFIPINLSNVKTIKVRMSFHFS